MARGQLRIRILGDVKDLARALDSAGSKFDRFRKGATVAASAIGAGLFAAAKQVGDAASKQQQAIGGLESVFKGSTAQMLKWADSAATAVGLSKTAYASLAAPIGASLKNAGFSMDQLGEKTNQLIVKGADLAATFGTTTEEAVTALGAALRGEFDPLERYGAALTASQISAELAARGQSKLTGAALEAAKKQATLDLIMRQTADSTGQFAREANSAAGAAQIQAAKWDDLQAKLGEALLPTMTKLAGALSEVADWASKNSGTVTTLTVVFGGLTLAVLAINGALAVYRAAVIAATAAQAVLNLVMHANPAFLVVAGIAALVAIFVVLWMKVEAFREFWKNAWEKIKNAFNAVLDFIKNNWPLILAILGGPAGAAVALVVKHWDKLKAAASTVKNFVVNTFNNLVGFFRELPGRLGRQANAAKNWVIDKFNELLDFIRGLPGRIADAVGGVFDALVAPFKKAKDTISSIISSLPSPGGFIDKATGWLPGRASGGPLQKGQLSIVGEQGPELFIPGASGMVVSNDQLRALLADSTSRANASLSTLAASGGGGGSGVSVTIHLEGGDAVTDALVRQMRTQVRVSSGGDVQRYLGGAR